MAGTRMIGFAGVAVSGCVATAAAGFGPPVGAAFDGVTDLAAGTSIADAGASALAAVAAGSGALPDIIVGFGLIGGAAIADAGATGRGAA